MSFLTERQMARETMLRDGDFRDIRDIIDRLLLFHPHDPILGGLDADKRIFTIDATQMHEEIMSLGDGLIDMGLRNKHIAIMADNSCRYVMTDICIPGGVGVLTPIDVEAPLELLETLLDKCDAEAIIFSARCYDRIMEAGHNCPKLKTLMTIDRKIDGIPFYDEVVARGEELKERSVYRGINVDLDAPAKILFTSGTTGANKGVVLTAANLIANIFNNMDTILAEPGNISMSVLPMHHATEINCHIMTRIANGRLTYINDSIRNMMNNIKIFKPHTITIVPMIANSFYRGIWAGAEKQGKADKLRKGIKISNLLRKFGIDKTHEMFSDLFAPFGGNLRLIICGGAMLNPEVVKGMNELGVRLENGYGITECGPLISINANALEEHMSVGKACPSLEVKIDSPDENGVGELCVRGKSVSKGYYKDPQATAKSFDEDGFFHTGDSARIDKKGKIFLAGRKKNTIVLESGKNICPEEVENLIETKLPYAADVVYYQAKYSKGANECKVLCAGLYISDEVKRADRQAIAADIREVNRMLPAYKRIEYIELPDKEYPKTSTRKIRRSLIPDTCSNKGIQI